MCLGGGSVPEDKSGDIAAEQQRKKEANVAAGRTAIENVFGNGTADNPGQFGQDYYDKISKNYEDYYNPQLDTQYKNALNQLTLQLGQQGILSSSEGNRQLALLNQNNGTQKQTIANNALSQAGTAKTAVANQYNSLLQQNEQAADPSAAAISAAQGAQAVQSTPTYSPLGAVFAGLLGQGTNALSIQQGSTPSSSIGGGNGNSFVQPISSNNGRVVNG